MEAGMAEHVVIEPKTYYKVFAALIILTLTTVGLDFVPLGPFHTSVGLLIAVIKAGLVILFFMHALYSSRLTWLVALSSLLWLAILMSYTLTDYMSRPVLLVPGH
jgi:cytochrome c oxidase subunit 4